MFKGVIKKVYILSKLDNNIFQTDNNIVKKKKTQPISNIAERVEINFNEKVNENNIYYLIQFLIKKVYNLIKFKYMYKNK